MKILVESDPDDSVSSYYYCSNSCGFALFVFPFYLGVFLFFFFLSFLFLKIYAFVFVSVWFLYCC